jgi:hypothetical protein
MRSYLRIPLRLLLPVLNVLIAVALFHMSHEQSRRPHMEPLSPRSERARYVEYAFNIPAWAAQSVTPWVFHFNEGVTYWETMETERDWWYMLYVILMWYCIGRRLDERRRGDVLTEHKKSTSWAFLRRVFLLSYGLFICFRAFSIPRYLEHWFIAAAVAWGISLIVGNLYFLARRTDGPLKPSFGLNGAVR